MDESRSRVQLASIEAKHVSGGARAAHRGWETSRGFLVPSSAPCSAAAEEATGLRLCRRKPGDPGAEHGFSAFILWLELLLQGFCVSPREGCPCSVTSCPVLGQPGSGDACLRSPSCCTCCSPRAVRRERLSAACGSGCWPGAGD